MSDKTVRTHTHVSNRARARRDNDSKVVFKSVLDNPFRIQWPSVPINVQNGCLAVAIKMADGIFNYRHERGIDNRKRKRGRNEAAQGAKKRKFDVEADNAEIEVDKVSATEEASSTRTVIPEPPSILQHLILGINEVTRRLEAQISSYRRTVTVSDETATLSDPLSQSAIKVIFVCRADINPSILVDHIPHLVAACNAASRKTPNFIKLVPLPKGAEFTLAQALGLRRVAVMAVDCNAPNLSSFDSLLGSVPILTASWLVPHEKTEVRLDKHLVPTHVKQLRTSVPKDMKAAKEQRSKGKAAAKERTKRKGKEKQV